MFQDFAILASVATNPSHPYQLLDHLNGLGVRATRSTLYRRVDALVHEGYLAAHEEPGERGHSRRALELTESGRGQLAEHVGELLREQPLESPMFALAVSCAELAGSEELNGILRARMATAARRLTEEERALANTGGAGETWTQAARERRIAHLKADVAWLQSVLGRRIVPRESKDEGRATG